MNRLLVLFAVAIGWVGLRGRLEPSSVGSALALGVLVVAVLRERVPVGPPLGRLPWFAWRTARVLLLLFYEMVVSNVDQLRVILRPRLRVRPAWVELHTRLETPFMRAVLAVMIAMTPMTLMCGDRRSDGRRLLIHILDTDDAQAVVRRLRHRLERPLLELEALWRT